MKADFKIAQNDTSEPLEGTIEDEFDSPVDLTGASVDFHMKQHGVSSLKVDAAAVILDAAGGVVAYKWATGDTDTPGIFYAEFEVTHSDGSIETFPSDKLVVYIRDEVG